LIREDDLSEFVSKADATNFRDRGTPTVAIHV